MLKEADIFLQVVSINKTTSEAEIIMEKTGWKITRVTGARCPDNSNFSGGLQSGYFNKKSPHGAGLVAPIFHDDLRFCLCISPWYPFAGAAFLSGGCPGYKLLFRLGQLPLQLIHLMNVMNFDLDLMVCLEL